MAAGCQCNTGRVLANFPALTFLSKIQFSKANSDAVRYLT